MRRKTTLHFDREQDQWCAQLEGQNYPLHCGESFLLYIGRTAHPCRLELDASWYVIMPETQFALHTSTVYMIGI